MKPSGVWLGNLGQWLERIPRKQMQWGMTAGIFLLAASVGLIGIQQPWQKRRQQMGRQLQEEGERSRLLSTFNQQGSELKTKEEQLLLVGGTSVLTSEISRLASQAGLQIESVVPQPESTWEGYGRSQIQVAATATFTDLMRFLRLLERHRPALKLDRVEIGESFPTGGRRSSPAGQEGPLPGVGISGTQKIQLVISAFSGQGKTS